MAKLVLDKASVEFTLPTRLAQHARDASRRLLGGAIDRERHSIKALDEITLSVRDGDRLGIIGHNGAGKTTLLRVLAGIYVPTSGSAHISGRISTMLTALPGLDVNETGLENIRTCSLFYGMSGQSLRAKIDDIVAFTELGDYLDMPVRVYSTGMLTRLNFAVATAIEPEVLIMDEGLATGDAAFATKAEARIKDLIKRSAIVIFASHSLSMLKSMCTSAIALEKGRMVAQGAIGEVADAYYKRLVEGAARGEGDKRDAVYVAAQDLVSRGERVPLNVEEQALIVALMRMPNDVRMIMRLCVVLRQQGKEVPDGLRAVELREAIKHTPNPTALQLELEAVEARLAADQSASGAAP